ncbi:MAG: hydantoinase/oxoprolinase family protein, partial [Rhodospirillaceae bacterium]
GITEMVDETMSNAARVHAVEQGKSAADYTLVAFGGAAPLHAGRLAEKLAIDRFVVPTNAGVGSAVGFLQAPIAYEVVRSRNLRLRAFDADAVNALFAEMRAEAAAVVERGAPGRPLVETRLAYMRYRGQGHEIAVALPVRAATDDDAAAFQALFDVEYGRLYQRTLPNAEVEVLTWALTLTTEASEAPPPLQAAEPVEAVPAGRRPLYDPRTG